MGSPMVCNIRKPSMRYSFTPGLKRRPIKCLEAGAQWVEDIQDLASRVDVFCTMVGYPEDVESVVLGEKDCVGSLNPESLLIDFTTSSPDLAERIAQKSI